MITKKEKFSLAFLAAAASLLLAGGALRAQETNAEQAVGSKPEVRTNTAPGAQENVEAPDAVTNPTTTAAERMLDDFHRRFELERDKRTIRRHALVVIGKDAVLNAGETAETVVVIGGSAKIFGKVLEEVVAIGGDIEVEGEVGNTVVAVLGKVKVGPQARIYGDLVAVGGKAEVMDGAKVLGETQDLDFDSLGLPHLQWLRDWFRHCGLKLRPLAPQVGWVWAVAGVFFLIYVLAAVMFPRPVQASVSALGRRPATTFIMGLLTILLFPFVLALVSVTVIGIPFVFAALVLAGIVGKVAILECLGFRLGQQFSGGSFQKPLLALLLGAIPITLLYLVPVLGLLTFGIIGMWGLGGAVTAAFGGFRRELPEKRAPGVPTTGIPAPAPAGGAGVTSTGAVAGEPAAAGQTQAAAEPLLGAAQAAVPETLAYPRAGFWRRLAAGLLDIVLVSILSSIVRQPPIGLVIALAYFAGLWTWRGTTIGGIVLGLKVARVDGQRISLVVAIVRALAAAFSVVVMFLGFLWIAWDPEKQGWHDKIAGTVVLRQPRAMPLICI